MKEIPILFSTEMVKAILDGKKTQTRRIIKEFDPKDWRFSYDRGDGYFCFKNHTYKHGGNVLNPSVIKCRYGQTNDVLWVRETWCKSLDVPGEYYYKASNPEVWSEGCDGSPWKPSIHMPKKALRIWLRRTGTRVERLNDISEQDAIAEGCRHAYDMHQPGVTHKKTEGGGIIRGAASFRRGYRLLWDKINGEDSWHQNPWVWVIEFERVEKPK